MKITNIYVRRLKSKYTGPVEAYSDTCIVNATDIYPDFVRHSAASRVAITPVPDPEGGSKIIQDFLYVETDEGITGVVGPITFPGITYYLLNHVKHTLMGQDPMRIEYLHDIMYRIGLDQTAGDLTRAVSHAEIALWDIKCKKLGVPLYELLGGKVRDGAPEYTNTAGLPHDDNILLPILKEHTEAGSPGVKIYSKYGPVQGREGIKKTCETLEKVRACIGPDKFIAVEAVCCWDYEYTMELVKAIEHLNIAWLEEPCLPDRMDEYARLKRDCPIAISGGEHDTSRWKFRQMLEMDACDIYQPEPAWGGGITETMSIINLVGAFNRKVYLHQCIPNVNAHIMAATNPAVVPMTEYLLTINEASQYFLQYPSRPQNGKIYPPEVVGVGCDVDESKVENSEIIE